MEFCRAWIPNSTKLHSGKKSAHAGYRHGQYMAGDEGFEPPRTVPETAVLPLDESPALCPTFYHNPQCESNISTWESGEFRSVFIEISTGNFYKHAISDPHR